MTSDDSADIAIVLRELASENGAKEHVLTLMHDEILHIGRSSKLPYPRLLFSSDPEMSSRHAVILPKFRTKRARSANASRIQQGVRQLDVRGISIKDLGSLNGAFWQPLAKGIPKKCPANSPSQVLFEMENA